MAGKCRRKKAKEGRKNQGSVEIWNKGRKENKE
jgi:hypothetical protein